MSDHSDSFISDDDDSEVCPLCVEPMDVTDRSFKPCPCGYQICQFCYNNIRTNPELNGRCPACRRPYDDKNIEYTPVDADDLKQQQQKSERRKREKRQQEKERKDAEMAKRHHLAGVRVIQKNLVYVVGLNPLCPPEDLPSLLRSDKYFGQYGRILKIVINKRAVGPGSHHPAPPPGANPSYGVYVTFAKKEDAGRCIRSIDGSVSDGRILKAAYGTTKYCSSYLRGVPCPNPNCMFLHEPGEEADTFSRQDLSTRSVNSRMQQEQLQQERVAMHGLVTPLPESDNNSPHVSHVQLNNIHHAHEPALPSTASWGKGNGNGSSSNSHQSLPPETLSAFPTLGDALQKAQRQQQQQIQQQQQQQQQQQSKKKDKRDKDSKGGVVLDRTLLSYKMIGESLKQLNNQDEFSYTIRPAFRKEANDGSSFLLFHTVDMDTLEKKDMGSLEDDTEKQHMQQLVDSLLFTPYSKNYTYKPVLQGASNTPSPQESQPQLQMQAVPGEQQQQQQQQFLQPRVGTPVQQQATQQFLQQQFLQQQFLQQQRQQQQRQQTGTPPPPGLFNPSATEMNNKSHSTELLNQLMGKKVAA
ncbi:DEKNAAC102168 [Brettanomyces naardenensis]|uniref:DEKNAAC102168 n=1 Tax=Brettanomyces naardenensis TaxID=13370 RepID=A0A448YK75_BRENA|nr:DEKNAAC102168 [Brettanomyces naardenensis]